MHFFYIRNKFSLQNAQSIILRESLNVTMAGIVDNNQSEYLDKVTYEINFRLWTVVMPFILKEDFITQTKKLDLFFLHKFTRILKISRTLKKIEDFFKEFGITDVYLSNIQGSLLERIIYTVTRKTNVRVFFYEEGLNLYLDRNFKKKILHRKGWEIYSRSFNLCRQFTYLLFIGLKASSILTKDPIKLTAEAAYLIYPDLYNFDNVFKKVCIVPSFKIQVKDKRMFDCLENKSLILWRPFSEDGLMSLDEEIALFSNVLRLYDNPIVKFHPRESLKKIDDMLFENSFESLPESLNELSAEILAYNSNLKHLVGIETNTLFYLSEFTLFSVHSYLPTVLHLNEHFKVHHDFCTKHFKKVKYIKLS